MNDLKRKMVASGLGLGLLAGGAAGAVLGSAGISGAQETTTTQAPVEQPADARPEAGTDPAPADQGSSAGRPTDEAMQQRHKEGLAETLAPLVEAGTIDQAQADAVIEALVAARPERGPGGKGGPGAHGMRGGPGLDAAAEALGITTDELREALQGGSSLAEIAEQKGVNRQAVIDALTTEAKERIMTKLSEGSITQEQADERLAELDARIADRVDNSGGGAGPGGPGRPGPSDGSAPEGNGSSKGD